MNQGAGAYHSGLFLSHPHLSQPMLCVFPDRLNINMILKRPMLQRFDVGVEQLEQLPMRPDLLSGPERTEFIDVVALGFCRPAGRFRFDHFFIFFQFHDLSRQ